MSSYADFVNDYNNQNITAHEVRRINNLNGRQYSHLRKLAIINGDIPPVRHMNNTGAKFYIKTSNGKYQVQKTIGGKKIVVGRFPSEETAQEIVNACIDNDWDLKKIEGLIDLKKIKPKNYSCTNNYWIIQKSINGRNIIFNSFSCDCVNEDKICEIVEFYRSVNWDLSYADMIPTLFKINGAC